MLLGLKDLIWVVATVFFVWALVLSILFYRLAGHYQRLTQGITKKDLGSVLEKLLKDDDQSNNQLSQISKQLKEIEKEALSHLQKAGLVRFNPFAETGGDQSFSLALLDGSNSGLVISSLYSREATRIYAKPVKEGKEAGYTFSDEEERAIKGAKKIK